jgi:dephospho-CoA kinase
MSEITKTWFEEAKKLEVGQAIFVRVANKLEQTKLANEFEEERELWSQIEPVIASQIFINKTLLERKQYVVLERKYRAPFTAFFRDKEGKFSTVSIDPERKRMIRLMKKDGKDRKEIEDILNGLTDDELKEFFGEG